MAAPQNYSGSVALGGSNVTLATGLANCAALKIGSAVFGNTGTAAVVVKIQDNASPTPNVLLEAVVPAGGSVSFNFGVQSDITLIAGNTATLIVPSGSGTLTYTLTFH